MLCIFIGVFHASLAEYLMKGGKYHCSPFTNGKTGSQWDQRADSRSPTSPWQRKGCSPHLLLPSFTAVAVSDATSAAGLKSWSFKRRARCYLRGIESLPCSQFERAALSGCDTRAWWSTAEASSKSPAGCEDAGWDHKLQKIPSSYHVNLVSVCMKDVLRDKLSC